jgi:cobyrinic acid a,c-diamide synthase
MGPDYLDPMILEAASGAAVYQIDLWMMGEAECRRLLAEAAMDADVILVEGVMGLYDGSPSAADLAVRLGLPVLLLIDAWAMAQTFGAVALGLASYAPGLRVAGVVANRVASSGHESMLRESLPGHLQWYGALRRESSLILPERHLGLYQAEELNDLLGRLNEAADAIAAAKVADLPPAVRHRVAIEALQGDFWYKYVGLDGDIIAMSDFGKSAPGAQLMAHFGFTIDNVTARARALLD